MYTWLARSAICRCGAVSDCAVWLAGESLRERRVCTPALAVEAGPVMPGAGARRRAETESEDEGLEEVGPVVPDLVASSGEDRAGTESEDEGLEEADGQAEAGEADLSRVD